jgi:hypothetical protein
MFGSSVGSASRRIVGRRIAGLSIAVAASTLFGACAHNPGDVPALQWQVNTVDATQAQAPAYSAAGRSSDSGYVYRGGRDPDTGRAYTQL